MRRALIIAVLAAVVAIPVPPAAHPTPAPGTDGRPNIVLILTDDQRADQLRRMPTLQAELVAKGTTFAKAYTVNPLCCPSRATILTGQYSHTTGVYANEGSRGGWDAFRPREPLTIATALQVAGYRTALVGKYLNQYNEATHVPPGWDRWVAMTHVGYFGIPLSVDGAPVRTGRNEYATDVFADFAVEFIEGVSPEEPLFLYFAPYAPHEPADPAVRDRDAFSSLDPARPPSYDERDRSDKPAYVRRALPISSASRTRLDELRTNMLRALLAVDRSIDRIVDALRRTGRLRDTIIMFASDNGYLLGEHGLSAKNLPYEESVRIPLVVRWDGRVRPAATDRHVVGNVDFAPTWAALAGATLPGAEGRSLVPLFDGQDRFWRDALLIEHGQFGGAPAFCQLHGERYSYVRYATGEEELYDLASDPYQLANVALDPAYASVRSRYRTRVALACLPRPPGWSAANASMAAGALR
ncbi:MAG: sulfatase [Actinomycetota bacterium]